MVGEGLIEVVEFSLGLELEDHKVRGTCQIRTTARKNSGSGKVVENFSDVVSLSRDHLTSH